MFRGPKSRDPLDELIARIRVSRFPAGIRCPRCGGLRHSRWGTFRFRQRYRCSECRRTFSDLTQSPAAYAKKIQLWPEFAALLASGTSLRHAAAVLGVHPATAFRWRHALLRALDGRDGEMLSGWIELAEQRFTLSEKGSRRLRRPARRRGSRPGSPGDSRPVHVMAACDRLGHCVSTHTITNHPLPGPAAFERLLSGRVGAYPVILEARGRFGAAARVTHSLGGTFHDARTTARRERRSLVNVDTARACVARLRVWLRRFRGVSTRYLPNYLIWHRTVDREQVLAIGEVALRWPGDAVPW